MPFSELFFPFETVAEKKVAVSLERERDATRSLAIVRFEILARASCELSGRNVSRGRCRAKNYFGTTTRLFGESCVRESSDTQGCVVDEKRRKDYRPARETTGKDACNNARRVPLAEKQA